MLNEAAIRCGTLPYASFAASGVHGDWQTFHAPFDPWFPAGAAGKVRVIVSASDTDVDVSDHQAVPVTLVGEVSIEGFTAWVRNSDISPGQSGLSWIAVAEVADAPPTARKVRPGVVQPQHFQLSGVKGDWRRWAVGFGSRPGFTTPPAVVVTATNTNVRVHASAAVGVACGTTLQGFNLAGRSADITPGACNFNYLAVSPEIDANPRDLQVDSGQLSARLFAVAGDIGDWQVWAVQFAEPFLNPPVVLATANNCAGTLPSYSRAASPVIFDTSTDGFTLAARNTDLCAGPAGFAWVAAGTPF